MTRLTQGIRFLDFSPLLDAARKTNLSYIGLYLALAIGTYAITYGINALASPIASPIAHWLGAILILTTAGAGLTLIGTITLDRAEELNNTFRDALPNMAKAIPITATLMATALLLITITTLFGLEGLGPTSLFLAWTAPLTINALLDLEGNPFTSIVQAVTNTVRHYAKTIPVLIATSALLVCSYLLPPLALYTLPYMMMLGATLYTSTAESFD